MASISGGRMKAVAKGTVDPTRLQLVRKGIECDVKALENELKALPLPYTAPVSSPTSASLPNGSAAAASTTEPSGSEAEAFSLPQGIAGPEGSILWKHVSGTTDPHFPQRIHRLIEQVRAVHNVGKDLQGWDVTYYPPPNGQMYLRIPPPPGMVGARYVLCLGSPEYIDVQVKQGKADASTKVRVAQNDSISLPIGVAQVCTLVVDNTTGFTMEARKGFRAQTIRKQPSNRHIVVLDGYADAAILTKKININAKAVAADAEGAQKIIDAFDINLKSENTTAAASASAS